MKSALPPSHRVLIIGAGAVGCTLAWHLSATRASTTLLARGAALDAISREGITLWQNGRPLESRRIETTKTVSQGGPWDTVLICVKQYDLAAVLQDIAPLVASGVSVVPFVNGIPWWLLRTHPLLKAQPLASWGPNYCGLPELPLASVLGGVIHFPAHLRDACNVEQGGRNSLLLGELNGSVSDRLQRLADLFSETSLECQASSQIQTDLWNKLLGNTVFNPVSALANATMREMLTDADLRQLCAALMAEVRDTGKALGLAQTVSVEQRLAQAESAGDARTSMLQDALAGRRLEGEALLGIVTRIARSVGVPAPMLDGIWALLQSRYLRNN